MTLVDEMDAQGLISSKYDALISSMSLLAEAHGAASRAFRDYAVALSQVKEPLVGIALKSPSVFNEMSAGVSLGGLLGSKVGSAVGINLCSTAGNTVTSSQQTESKGDGTENVPWSSQEILEKKSKTPGPEHSDIVSSPPAVVDAEKHGKKRRRPKDPDAPKAPTGSWIWFLKEFRPKVKEELGTEVSNTDFNAKLKEYWNNLTESERGKFEALAAKDRDRYLTQMETYKASSGPEATGQIGLAVSSDPIVLCTPGQTTTKPTINPAAKPTLATSDSLSASIVPTSTPTIFAPVDSNNLISSNNDSMSTYSNVHYAKSPLSTEQVIASPLKPKKRKEPKEPKAKDEKREEKKKKKLTESV